MGNRYWGKIKSPPKYRKINGLFGFYSDIWNPNKEYYGRAVGEIITISRHRFIVILTEKGKNLIVKEKDYGATK